MWTTLAPVFFSFLVVQVLSEDFAGKIVAVAVLRPYASSPSVTSPSGNVTFIQHDDGTVTVKGFVTGLKKNTAGSQEHGFHIHEKGDLREGCASLGGHYNPQQKQHGAPDHEVRHIGDLGNIEASPSGVASFEFEDKIISLTGPYSILGRGLIVHSDKDDFGRGMFNDSTTTGHAGSRVACGVIGLVHPIYSSSLQNIAQSSTIVLSLIALKFLF
ncbi:superoxide dismutase [Cu-Zn] isoform X2 [Diaphorina citri]|uniref:Superoxide dismutase [Cu-Zn] n=1 Tax=Diaphorina citri TaxID=121845 RepID=A0A3Q0INQ8_DIACI|nr:superoxide dismutase [Cu-Zn] isoform X1 [Diaphorina citri]XP_026677939.1 superoxide dismutase [Cu-Zn] isoform X2 [Diaphorina citri]KAI5695356.1 hypothetical protein M8J75_015288 [Diaphorina citri]KAI5716655.1 hypothetical protein M8J76_010076 [Diaphorina citri]KAI5717803.1 hypothetical protein M8J77_011526 [Diaphorina citri]